MTKLSVFSAVFAALIAVSVATTYTTTVVTDITPEQACQSEIQQVSITPCKQHVVLTMGTKREREHSFLRSGVANPRQESVEAEERLQQCCEQLRSVSPSCRGDAVRRVMKEMTETYGVEMRRTRDDEVRQLTQKCNLKRTQNYMI